MKHFKHLFCITDLQKYKTNTKRKLYLPDWIFCVYYDEYNEHNFIAKCQYNTTLLPSVNTIALGLGMLCGAKYTHHIKHNMHMFQVIPFSKQHNRTAHPKAEKYPTSLFNY